MKIKYTLIISLLLIIATVLLSGFIIETTDVKPELLYTANKNTNLPTSIQMYDLIESKSVEYDIPKYILYNIAWMETRYEGPFDWDYNPFLTSVAGATGPMQVIPQHFSRQYVSDHNLKTDLKSNIDVSCKMLRQLHDTYGSWDIVLGCYNTGSPQINDYAIYGNNNKNYKSKWIEP